MPHKKRVIIGSGVYITHNCKMGNNGKKDTGEIVSEFRPTAHSVFMLFLVVVGASSHLWSAMACVCVLRQDCPKWYVRSRVRVYVGRYVKSNPFHSNHHIQHSIVAHSGPSNPSMSVFFCHAYMADLNTQWFFLLFTCSHPHTAHSHCICNVQCDCLCLCATLNFTCFSPDNQNWFFVFICVCRIPR